MLDGSQIAVITSCLVSSGVYGIRFYMRIIVPRQLRSTELFLLLATVLHITESGVEIHMLNVISNIKSPYDAMRAQLLFFINGFVYFGALWSVKISVNLFHAQISEKLPDMHKLAIRSLYFMGASWVVVYIAYLLGCIPVTRRWEGVLGTAPTCPPVQTEWDFWVHTALNLGSDVWLCILPYRALLQIQDRRLRLAICGLYSLACIIIVDGVIRVVLLARDSEHNLKAVIVLSSVEVTISIIIATIPGISSLFLRRYVYGYTTRTHTTTSGNSKPARPTECNTAHPRDRDETSIELSSAQESASSVYATDYGAKTESTENIIQIHKMKTVEVTAT